MLLQAILDQLPLEQYHVLRQVSKAVCQRTTQHVPYITLRLSDSSSTEQVQQGCQLMQGLSPVGKIHIDIAVEVATEVFELAMQLLSQRSTPVTELHLLSFYGHGNVASLQSLQHLLPNLQTLVIRGITVDDLVRDLQQLAAAAAADSFEGWPLQSLTLEWNNQCHWKLYSAAVQHLATAFPNLQQLDIRVPDIGFYLEPIPQLEDAAAMTENDLALLDPKHLIFCSCGLDSAAMYVFSHPEYTPAAIEREAATAAVAAIASLANAMIQLKQLQTLTVTEVPDIWRLRTRDDSSEPPVAAVAIAAAAPDTIIQAGSGLLPSAAAAAFSTLEDLGCWLLQHHPKLLDLRICTDEAAVKGKGCSLSWQCNRKLQPAGSHQTPLIAGSSNSSKLTPIDMSVAAGVEHYLHRYSATDFADQLSHYSSRPADDVMGHISSLALKIVYSDCLILPDLLENLKSLKHLEVSWIHSTLTRVDQADFAMPEILVETCHAVRIPIGI